LGPELARPKMPGHVPNSDVFNVGSSNTIKIMRVINPTDEICILPPSQRPFGQSRYAINLRSDEEVGLRCGCRCCLISSGCHNNFRLIMMRVMAWRQQRNLPHRHNFACLPVPRHCRETNDVVRRGSPRYTQPKCRVILKI